VGKVVKVRKTRRRLYTPKTLAIVLVVVVLSVITVFTYYTYRPSASEGTSTTLKPYEILKSLVEGNDTNAILVYSVSGNLLVNTTVLGVYDRLVFLVQPIYINQSEGSENVSFIKYYLIRYDENYLSNYLLPKLGTAYVTEELNNLLVNKLVLNSTCSNFSKKYLGEVSKYVRPLGEVGVKVYEVMCDSAVITESLEATYNIPVEVVYAGGNTSIRVVLDDVMKY